MRLHVLISGLPHGTPGNVRLAGPHGFQRRLRASEQFTGVSGGVYRVQVTAVHLPHAYHGVPAGSEAFPSASHFTVRAMRGRTTLIRARYGTIRNARDVALHSRPISVTGPASDPTAVLLSGTSSGLHAGSIVAQAPSRVLPSGLFDRVVGVRRTRRGILVSVKPASLAEAFPAIDIDERVPFGFGSASSAGSASVANALSDVDLAFSVPLIPDLLEASCGAPPTGWSFSPFGSLRPTLNANLHSGFLGLIYGELSLTLAGSLGFDATIPSGAHCDLTVDGPQADAIIPVAGIPVPVEGSLDLKLSLALTGPAQAHASANVSVTGGANLHGAYATPILTIKPSASGSVTASGAKLSLGPQMQVGLGLGDVNAHIEAGTDVADKTSGAGCEIDLGASAGVGIDFLALHASFDPFDPEVPIYHCPRPPELSISQTSPPLAFPDQEFEYTIDVTNKGATAASNVSVIDTLPSEGSFVSSTPGGSPSSPAPASTYSIPLGSLGPGDTSTVRVRWHAPSTATTLTNSATAQASNATQAGPAAASVAVGESGTCNPCGAASAGTGLRNRNRGAITISAIPPGATVTQAVLVWGILYAGQQPTNQITFDGHPLTANLTSHVSGTLCWGDEATVGYAADVTPYVTGNGTFEVTNPPNGEVRVDENPYGVLPYTDGASLVVFYDGGGADNQVLSNFSYNTNTDPATEDSITRTFSGVNSVGGPASLTLAGPDGQNDAGKLFTFTGSTELVVGEPFQGRAPQEGPNFPIGNLWDDEEFDVSPILPAGQPTLTFNSIFHQGLEGEDCIGVGAAVLQVAQ